MPLFDRPKTKWPLADYVAHHKYCVTSLVFCDRTLVLVLERVLASIPRFSGSGK